MEGDREKCLLAGMNDYVGKPMRLEELRAALARHGDRGIKVSSGAPTAPPEPGQTARTPALSTETPLVDLDRLRDVNDDDPERIRRLVNIYLTQAIPLLEALQAAIETNSGDALAQAAHKLVGSSISCGVQAFTEPLRELERLGQANDLTGAAVLFDQVRRSFSRVRISLNQFLQDLPALSHCP
jgi:two-component system, sensor histidine kinase and response regulator